MYLSYHGCDPGVERRTCLILSSKQEAPVEKENGSSVVGPIGTCVDFPGNARAVFLMISTS